MNDLPAPPVPAECDLQDFPFMPLQVARLRDSELAAEEHPEACWYAVLLWAASWHQIPAASLPDNDLALMRLVGLGRDERTWKKHKAGALRGFVRCSDGRLYHSVVAEQANEAWESKLRQRHRTFCGAVRKHNERNPAQKLESPTFDEWLELGRPDRVTNLQASLSRATDANVTRDNEASHADVACDIGSKRQGQGQGQGDSRLRTEPIGSAAEAARSDPPSRWNSPPEPPPTPTPADIAKAMFDAGIRVLAVARYDERQARSLIGKWRKLHGDGAVLAVLSRCPGDVSEPVEWITKALQGETARAAGRAPPQSQPPARRSLVEIGRGVAAELADEQAPRLAAH